MNRELASALRFLSRNPLFTAAATVILALGIGASTAAFSIVDAVLLRPLPYAAAERLIRIEEVNPKLVIRTISAENFRSFENRDDLFERAAPFRKDVVTLTNLGAPEQVMAERTSAQLFAVLGVHAALGRTLAGSDDALTAPNVVVLSDRIWRRLFQADPAAIGRPLTVSGEVSTIVGVMPPEFEFPQANIELWIPLRLTSGFSGRLEMVARMRPGISIYQVRSAMDVIARQLERQNRKENAGMRLIVSGWREDLDPQYRLSVLLILAAVGLVLLIACANVSSLLLTRMVGRKKEISIRAALGAGFRHVLRQLLVESFLLAFIGGLVGIVLARSGIEILARQLAALPIVLPHMQHVTLNGRVLWFSTALCIVIAVLSSLAPLLLVRNTDLQVVLRSGAGSGSRSSTRLFSLLVASEAAFAFLLLAGSGLLMRSLARLERADNGFRADHVLTMRVPLGTLTQPRPQGEYASRERQIEFYREVLERLQRVPGVKAAAVVNNLPLSGSTTSTVYKDADGSLIPVMTRTISPDYFAVMGTALIEGRVFDERDHARSPQVAIINEFLARRFFPDRDPIGQFLPTEEDMKVAVVGVVKNSWQLSYDEPSKGEVFIPYRQFMFGTFLARFVVRTSGDPLTLADASRKQVWAVDANEPVTRLETLDDVIARAIWRPRFSAWAFAVLSGLALLLTCAGVYAVVAYTTALKTRDIGIRVALGASPQRVVLSVLGDALAPVCAGIGVSIIVALPLTRLLASLLYGIRGTDPVTYLAAGAALMTAGAAASLRPARLAATADPLVALRTE